MMAKWSLNPRDYIKQGFQYIQNILSQCSICLELYSQSVMCKGSCKSIFCNDCATNIKRFTNRCPKRCSQPFATVKMARLECQFRCPFDNNCPYNILSIEAFRNHHQICRPQSRYKVIYKPSQESLLFYSLTQTGVHFVCKPSQYEPQVKIQCKCNRLFLQEEIYTCIYCSTYCCKFCTTLEVSFQQCRGCRRLYQPPFKNSRCYFCFACPYCQNVLALSRDPKSKLYIYFCQFCYWNTKQISMKYESPQILQERLFKYLSLRGRENVIYDNALTFFNNTNSSVEIENLWFKHTNYQRPSFRSMEISKIRNRQQTQKINEDMDELIKHSSLDDEPEDFTRSNRKQPQALSLLAKKIRGCPHCARQLTNIYQHANSTQSTIQLIHKDLKIIKAQRLPPANGFVRIKFLKNCVLNEKPYNINEQEEVEANRPLKILATIENKRKYAKVTYSIFIDLQEENK